MVAAMLVNRSSEGIISLPEELYKTLHMLWLIFGACCLILPVTALLNMSINHIVADMEKATRISIARFDFLMFKGILISHTNIVASVLYYFWYHYSTAVILVEYVNWPKELNLRQHGGNLESLFKTIGRR